VRGKDKWMGTGGCGRECENQRMRMEGEHRDVRSKSEEGRLRNDGGAEKVRKGE
jgi:hypothetical protein